MPHQQDAIKRFTQKCCKTQPCDINPIGIAAIIDASAGFFKLFDT